MIIGLGIDLVDNSRFERELARGNWLPDEGIFTSEELTYCTSWRKPAAAYAACFAAKEAMLKALGIAPSDLASFREAEVQLGNLGNHDILLHGRLKTESQERGVKRISLSVARNVLQTIAVVILEA